MKSTVHDSNCDGIVQSSYPISEDGLIDSANLLQFLQPEPGPRDDTDLNPAFSYCHAEIKLEVNADQIPKESPHESRSQGDCTDHGVPASARYVDEIWCILTSQILSTRVKAADHLAWGHLTYSLSLLLVPFDPGGLPSINPVNVFKIDDEQDPYQDPCWLGCPMFHTTIGWVFNPGGLLSSWGICPRSITLRIKEATRVIFIKM